MVIIPRHVCREISNAFALEWMVRNGRGGYAAGSIGGALTRRQHGLLVTPPKPSEAMHVLLAKVDEEVEVEGHVYKLGTNEFQNNVLNPDGFLFLQQVTLEGALACFEYEVGRFQMTRSVWMEPGRATTFIHYLLAEQSVPVQFTLLPLCDYRATNALTTGREDWHFQVTPVPNGLRVTAYEGAMPYRILTSVPMTFTPLDLWYWHFQLRQDASASTDLYVPGLLRMTLEPGASLTLVATSEADASVPQDMDALMQQARRHVVTDADLSSDPFTPAFYRSTE
jgi:predicted glycogen debranching enzyme